VSQVLLAAWGRFSVPLPPPDSTSAPATSLSACEYAVVQGLVSTQGPMEIDSAWQIGAVSVLYRTHSTANRLMTQLRASALHWSGSDGTEHRSQCNAHEYTSLLTPVGASVRRLRVGWEHMVRIVSQHHWSTLLSTHTELNAACEALDRSISAVLRRCPIAFPSTPFVGETDAAADFKEIDGEMNSGGVSFFWVILLAATLVITVGSACVRKHRNERQMRGRKDR